jgi:hypothetical protein
MKANELRIGNLVEYMGKELITTSEIIRECELNNATAQPVQLTTYRLIKLGFRPQAPYSWRGNGADYQPETSRTTCYDYVLNDNFFVRYCEWRYRKNEEEEWNIETSFQMFVHSWYQKCFEGEVTVIKPIEHVHQFQNIYFAISGEELTITQ